MISREGSKYSKIYVVYLFSAGTKFFKSLIWILDLINRLSPYLKYLLSNMTSKNGSQLRTDIITWGSLMVYLETDSEGFSLIHIDRGYG